MSDINAEKLRRSYNDVVRRKSNVRHTDPTNADEKSLIDRIYQLKKDVPPGRYDLQKTIDDIVQDMKTKEKIHNLEIRVYDLEQELAKWRKTAGTVDAGEAMKIMETHVAAFVLPPGKKVGTVAALEQMLEELKLKPNMKPNTWDKLLKQCGISKWSPEHHNAINRLITYRNFNAHHKKFDFAQLRKIAIETMPHREKQCADIINLFKKVNSLIKFGIITSDPVLREVVETKYSKAHVSTLTKVATHCNREVQHLQDVKTEEAKEHLVQYFPDVEIAIWENMIKEIEVTNGLRLGKLVREKEKQIVAFTLQDPLILTFDVMNSALINGKFQREKHTEVKKQWRWLTDGKEWSEYHGKAMAQLKNLLPANHFEEVRDLPLKTAQLHIPDFLDKRLWDAGSDILEIFVRWETPGR